MYSFANLLMAQALSPSLHGRTRAFLAAAWTNSRASEHPTVGPVIEVVDWESVGNDDVVVLERQLKDLLQRIGNRQNYSTREFKSIISKFNISISFLDLLKPHLRVLEDAPGGTGNRDKRLLLSLETVHRLALVDSEKQSFQILIQALEGVPPSHPSGRPLEYQLQVAEIKERNRRKSERTRRTGEASEEHHSEPSQAHSEPIYATVQGERTPFDTAPATYANARNLDRRRSLPDPPRKQVLTHPANLTREQQRSPSSCEFDDFSSGSDLNLSDTEARVFSPARVFPTQDRTRRKGPTSRHRRPTTPQRSPSPAHPWRDRRRRPHRSPSPRWRARPPPSPIPSPGSSPSPPPSPRQRRRPSGMPPPPQIYFQAKYGGSEDGNPEDFLDSLEAVWAMYGLEPQHYLTHIHTALTKGAKNFLESFIKRFGRQERYWELFKNQFISTFSASKEPLELWKEVISRKQKEGESVELYVTAKEILIRRADRLLREPQVAAAIIDGLRPEIASRLLPLTFNSVSALMSTAKKLEQSLSSDTARQVSFKEMSPENSKLEEKIDMCVEALKGFSANVSAVSEQWSSRSSPDQPGRQSRREAFYSGTATQRAPTPFSNSVPPRSRSRENWANHQPAWGPPQHTGWWQGPPQQPAPYGYGHAYGLPPPPQQWYPPPFLPQTPGYATPYPMQHQYQYYGAPAFAQQPQAKGQPPSPGPALGQQAAASGPPPGQRQRSRSRSQGPSGEKLCDNCQSPTHLRNKCPHPKNY